MLRECQLLVPTPNRSEATGRELGEEDDAAQLLAVPLAHYPAHLSIDELIRELGWPTVSGR